MKSNRGFTLYELMVVLTLLSLSIGVIVVVIHFIIKFW